MSKIVTAINAMISNPHMINSVTKVPHSSECYFKYTDKHIWSIIENSENEYYLHYYPNIEDIDIEELANISGQNWGEYEIKYVTYSSTILGTKEAKESLDELNSIVNEKLFGMDNILDDIINNSLF